MSARIPDLAYATSSDGCAQLDSSISKSAAVSKTSRSNVRPGRTRGTGPVWRGAANSISDIDILLNQKFYRFKEQKVGHMKRTLTLLTLLSFLSPVTLRASQTALGQFYCVSIRVNQGSGGQYGLDTLNLTTLSVGENSELAPLGPPYSYSHWSWFDLDSFAYGMLYGTLNVNTPPYQDANADGIDDFFESSQAVYATSSGIWAFDGGSTYPLTITWNRGAGSTVGGCTINLQGWGSFDGSFEILEYFGPVTYLPGSTAASGTLVLTQSMGAGYVFGGPFTFTKSSSNPHNQLTLQTGSWTNIYAQSLLFTTNTFTRNASWPTNYYGTVEFDDGDPNTADPDWCLWKLCITDTNDVDSDGIPDFSDDLQLPPPRRPALTLVNNRTNLLLKISGDVGHVHDVLELTVPGSTNWNLVTSVTLTNDPQTVSLALPGQPKFWRVQAH